MGCVIDFFMEFVFELLFEGFVAMVTMIIPKKGLSAKTQAWMKVVALLVGLGLLIALIVGVVFWITDVRLHLLGALLVIVSSVLLLAQIVAGIVVRSKESGD